ncbi:hypothetical protein ACFYYB_18830 [Streptomyces sp. NPDC002886]|uniref:hypothetical protein n=1 Tax=Streptomyces sp. NPDC002886 TaxID=3364667 RepID=UPI0036AAB753
MEPTSPPPMPTCIHRSGQRMALFLVGGVFALLGVVMLVDGLAAGDPFGVVLSVVIGAGGFWIVFRSCVLGVEIYSTGLTERGLGRSKVIPWCAIDTVGTGDGPGLAPAQAPGLLLKDGTSVGLGAIASSSSRIVDRDFALIKALHATHVTGCPHCA